MKILLITGKMPILSTGASVRNYHLANAVEKSGHRVQIAYYSHQLTIEDQKAINHSKFDIKYLRLPKRNVFKSIYNLLLFKFPFVENLKSHKFDEDHIRYINSFDKIILAELESYFFITPVLQNIQKPIILDMHNNYTDMLTAELFLKNRIFPILAYFHLTNFHKFEIEAIKNVSKILICAVKDSTIYLKHIQKRKLYVIPNGIDSAYFKYVKQSINQNVLFMGNLAYGPNEQGVSWYIKYIHQVILAKYPNYKLIIIGKDPSKRLQNLMEKTTNVQYRGNVNDIRNELDSTRICISPIFQGSGTRLKVLEYMAAGKPVISSSTGAEGIQAIPSKQIIIADTPNTFIDAVFLLMNSYSIGFEIGMNARKYVRANYDIKFINKLISNVIND